jgi:hypothetical protein
MMDDWGKSAEEFLLLEARMWPRSPAAAAAVSSATAKEAGLTLQEYWLLEELAMGEHTSFSRRAFAKLVALGYARESVHGKAYELTKAGLGLIASARL